MSSLLPNFPSCLASLGDGTWFQTETCCLCWLLAFRVGDWDHEWLGQRVLSWGAGESLAQDLWALPWSCHRVVWVTMSDPGPMSAHLAFPGNQGCPSKISPTGSLSSYRTSVLGSSTPLQPLLVLRQHFAQWRLEPRAKQGRAECPPAHAGLRPALSAPSHAWTWAKDLSVLVLCPRCARAVPALAPA